MAISKEAQKKIDALKNGDTITEEQTSEEVKSDSTPIELLDESDIPITTIESEDTVLEQQEFSVEDIDLKTIECPDLSEGRFRLFGIILSSSLSLKSNEDAVDRLVCSDDNKTLIRRFLKEEMFKYCYLIFNGERYSTDEVNVFIVVGQQEYDGPLQIILDQTQGINETQEVWDLKQKLKYDLSERISNLQFMVKNMDSVVNRYLDGGLNDFSELRLFYHNDVKRYGR